MAKMNISYRVSITDRFTKPLRKMQGQLESFKRTAEKIDNMQITPKVDAKTAKAEEDLEDVKDKADSIPRLIYIHFASNFKKFNRDIDAVSDAVRNFGVLTQNVGTGVLMALSPIGATIMSSVGAALGALIPILGVVGGGILGLGSAFTVAAGGIAAFAAVAGPAINGVFQAKATLANAKIELKNADTAEERAEALESLNRIQSNMSGTMKDALKAVSAFEDKLFDFKTTFNKPIQETFTKSIYAAITAMDLAKPTIHAAIGAVDSLVESFAKRLETEDIRKFFDWMATSTGPAIEALGNAGMNFLTGFMNLMRAFNPLAVDMQNGLLKMSESFMEWTSGLSESTAFQAFIDYVRENGPKLLSIIGNIVLGLVGMGEAFAPFAAKMLDGLVQLTEKFQIWGETLKNNPAFQEWIQSVIENGPQIITFISNLSGLLSLVAQAFSQVGEQLLPIVNGFLEWTIALIENNPWIAKAFAWIISLIGAAKILIPIVLGLVGAFRFMFPVIKLLGTLLLRLVGGPFSWITQGVILLAMIIIDNWESIRAFSIKVWVFVVGFLIETWDKIKKAFLIVKFLASLAREKFQEIKDAVKNKMSEMKQKIEDIWDKVEGFFEAIDLVTIGKNIIQGLVNGIMSIDLGSVIRGLADKIPDWIAGPLGIHSPSRVTMRLGEFIGEGLVLGMQKMKTPAERAADTLVSAVKKPFDKLSSGKLFRFKGDSPMAKYFNAILEDGDYLNDWITHLPKAIRGDIKNLGKQFAAFEGLTAVGNGQYAVPQRNSGGGTARESEVSSSESVTTQRQPIILQSILNGKVIAQETFEDITVLQDRESGRVNRFKGGGR